MNIHHIRDYLVEQTKINGYELDELQTSNIPKYIRYHLIKQVLSLNPSDDQIDKCYNDVIMMYIKNLPRVCAMYYVIDKTEPLDISIKNCIKQFWPKRKRIISRNYDKIYNIVEKIASHMKIINKQYYLDELPHYIEDRNEVEKVVKSMFEDHIIPVAYMFEIRWIIKETLEKLEKLEK